MLRISHTGSGHYTRADEWEGWARKKAKACNPHKRPPSAQSCVVDGEVIICDDNGVSVFNLIRYRHYDQVASRFRPARTERSGYA